MALNYTSDLMALFASKVGNDANYQAPGNFGLATSQTGAVGVDHVTITNAGSYTVQPTATPDSGDAIFAVRMKVVEVSAVAAAGTGLYVPGNVLTLTGGTHTTNATLTVTHTKVVLVTVVGVGAGGTPGAATLTGTTGTGTKFQATVVVQGDGTLTGAPAPVITVAGDYTVNPTDIAAEPVTATASLVGATVTVRMGVLTTSITQAGVYSALPANPVASTGGGNDATFTLAWGVNSIVVSTPGTYETVAPAVTFSAGAAAGTAVLTAAGDSNENEQKLLMLVEVIRSLIAEVDNVAQLKDVHEVLRKMLMAMKFGGALTFVPTDYASRALGKAMNYIAKNPSHSHQPLFQGF